MNIPKAIRVYRAYKSLTQAELAIKSGISKSFICKIENENRQPSIKTLKKMADAIGVEPQQLMADQVAFDLD